ncbi:SMI1/KNR4 family protein [Tenacibaculum tangerinum]|uniref:SMI1/KNR4 family protein n=1 Tax=Tenacibaculum tangerinum TaxID=3038772 RepID=A0ABY8L4I0_9FLAO|nr:SMI1/KNR4 family protein [Tenacibaculum tangerinum]WGH75103.1 SMI1/KNR4 family protein [Tenacibaculum tangerinum]
MIIEFYLKTNQKLSPADISDFETQIGKVLPDDYKQHMLNWNGGGVHQYNLEHVNFPEHSDYGLLGLAPISHSKSTILNKMNALSSALPSNYIPIGRTRGGGTILMSLENNETYGNIEVMFSEGDIINMSPSFSQFLEDMVEEEDIFGDKDDE